MKKLVKIMVGVMAILMVTCMANAWTLSWTHDGGDVVGYKVYYNDLATPDNVITADTGTGTDYILDDIGLVIGTRYEFWVTAYDAAGESPDSDHVRWTYPREPIIVEMLGAPVVITITP